MQRTAVPLLVKRHDECDVVWSDSVGVLVWIND